MEHDVGKVVPAEGSAPWGVAVFLMKGVVVKGRGETGLGGLGSK